MESKRQHTSGHWHVVPLALCLILLCVVAPAAAAASRPADALPSWRIGVQAGHWRIAELPEDQARLRGQTGGSGGGYREVDINLAVAELLVSHLTERGVIVDLLPATVPRGYRADAFVAIHCDASSDASVRGYKLARYRDSVIPERDDALLGALSDHYGRAMRLPIDANVTRAMTGYYPYNPRRFETVIDARTPGVIVELGYLTNPADRALLVGRQDQIAGALAAGILDFLQSQPAPLPAAPRLDPLRALALWRGDDER